jgi:hypothetical protein
LQRKRVRVQGTVRSIVKPGATERAIPFFQWSDILPPVGAGVNPAPAPDHLPDSLFSSLGSTANTSFPTFSMLDALILSRVSPAVCHGA